MKKLIIAVAVFYSTIVSANDNMYEFPRKMECVTSAKIAKYLADNYHESPLVSGSSMNSAGGSTRMVMTFNSKTKTYTIINYFADIDKACIIDSGTITMISDDTKVKL